MPESRQIDLRTMPPQLRHGVVFQCFDTLGTGASLVLVNDHDPMPLLQQFKFARPGESDYEYLERGPDAWRVRISRKAAGRHASGGGEPRSAAAADEPRSVTEYLEADHRRLDAILPDVERLVGAGEYEQAAARFAEFSSGLSRHIDVEEQILFPTFESATGMTAGPTQVMRAEHLEIRHWMQVIAKSLGDGEPEHTAEGVEGLRQTLSAHNMKEEHMLYPMTDQAMHGDAQRRELVSRLQAF